MRSLFTLLAFMVLAGLVVLAAPGCATIVPPQGGPIDSLPPVLTKAHPLNRTLDFEGNRIVLTFDEYVDVDNPQQNVIVSPLPVRSPNISRKLNTVNIKLRDSLEANTTYSINFGNSIADVNEKNIFRQFTYIFSTGNHIDSFQVTGNIKLAETGGIDSTLTVLLYRDGYDSAVIKTEPRYITKTDGTGNFIFRNLPADTFYVYALKSPGGTYEYRDKSALFAFADSAVITGPQPKTVSLNAYDIKKQVAAVTPAPAENRRRATEKRLKFQTSLKDNQDLLEKFSFTFEVPLKTFDSTKIHFTRDSSFTPVTNYRLIPDSLNKTYTLQYTWLPNTFYSFLLEKDFATDTLGQQLLLADTISFKTKALEDYGKLNLKFKNLDLTKNPVLQFIQNDAVVSSFPLTSNVLTKDLFLPGDYTLRLLDDRNGNGVWDPGQFPVRVQPELVRPLDRKLNIKPGSSIPIEIDLSANPVRTRTAAPAGTQPRPNRR
ncbi:MAG: Ig-like domain-containing protein [Chitinophagaceae bacterium]